MQKMTDELQELIKKHQIREHQWAQEKALLEQRIEQLSKQNRYLKTKNESSKKSFRELLKLYTEINTQNQTNFFSLLRTELATVQPQSAEHLQEVISRLNVG